MEKYIEIGGRLHSTATGNVTTGANEILDDELNKKQSQINSETLQHVERIDAALQELSPDQTQALALATDVNTLKAKSVRSDETQSLTDAEKEQAISNMGVTGVYDISGEHPVSGHPKKYSTLPTALADVPVGRRKSGMSVKALMQLTSEMYHVEVTEGVTDLPTGYNEYELSEASPMTTGDYTYSELDTENFSAIPSTVGASVLYYIYDSQSSSYTTWLLTKSSDSTYAYKQYLYMQEYADTTAGNTAFLTASNWQGVDDEPTAGSQNLVKSGGVKNELALGSVYDVSAKNPTAGPNNDGKFESLSALLSDANLNALIPTAVRRGGMSIKFVQSSDNNYIQYFCKSQTFATDTIYWEKTNLEDEINEINEEIGLTIKTDIKDDLTIVRSQYIAIGGTITGTSYSWFRSQPYLVRAGQTIKVNIGGVAPESGGGYPALAIANTSTVNLGDTVVEVKDVVGGVTYYKSEYKADVDTYVLMSGEYEGFEAFIIEDSDKTISEQVILNKESIEELDNKTSALENDVSNIDDNLTSLEDITTEPVQSENVLNPSTVSLNKNITTNGELVDSESYNTSDYIPTNGHTKVLFARITNNALIVGGYGWIAQYDSDKTFISRLNGSNPLTLDSQCAFIRVSFINTDTFDEIAFDRDDITIDELTEYYSGRIDKASYYLDVHTLYSTNLIDQTKLKTGYGIDYRGEEVENSSQKVSVFSEVRGGSKVFAATFDDYGFIYRNGVHIAQYEANHTFIRRDTADTVIQLNSNCAYIKASFGRTSVGCGVFDESLYNTLKIEDYSDYHTPYEGSEKLQETSVVTDKLFKTYGMKLPIPAGIRTDLYFKNLLYGNDTQYLGVMNLNMVGVQRADSVFVNPQNNSSFNRVNLKAYKSTSVSKLDGDDCSVDVQLVPSNLNSGGSIKALLLGDSYTGMGFYQKYANDLLVNNNISITWLGTLDGLESNLKNEGRGGWRAYTYCHYAEITGNEPGESIAVHKTNPFYNNGFDFAYYMNQQGYNGVDVVFINLGINDTAVADDHTDNESIIDSWNTIINSIHSYDANIKIVLWVATLPCTKLGVPSVYENFIRRMRMHSIIYDNFVGKTWGENNIYVIPTYLVTNTDEDYPMSEVSVDEYSDKTTFVPSDTVHLNEIGMHKLGNIIGATLQFLCD